MEEALRLGMPERWEELVRAALEAEACCFGEWLAAMEAAAGVEAVAGPR
jgi:hypothetical protein